MSQPTSDISDGEEDHAMDNIRAMLQDYYGTENGNEVKEEDYYDMDNSSFDKNKFIPKILKEQSLPELIKTNIRVINESKQLDSDMQKLVYENYSRFMSASKTVRTLQSNVGEMETKMSSLLERIQNVTSISNTVGSNLDANRTKVDKLVSVKRLLKKLQFLFDLPSRLERCVELEAYDQAVEYYISSTSVLSDYRHIKSFNTIQQSADSIMNGLKSKMLRAIQEPDIRMTQLEDFVRLLMKLGHPVEDLYTIYLNYHNARLTGIVDKYQKLKALSEDEKEIIALSGSEEEVSRLREKQKVTNDYPLLQFMHGLETEFIDLLIHVAVAYMDIFKDNESSITSLIAFTQNLMTKYLSGVKDRIECDKSYEGVLSENMSPFGEIRSALDMLYQHITKVDNIVKNTGIITAMRSIIKNSVKTQMAGSFDCVRSELSNLVLSINEAVEEIPTYSIKKVIEQPQQMVQVVEQTELPTESGALPSVDSVITTELAPIPGAGPLQLEAKPNETAQEALPSAPAVEKKETLSSVGKSFSDSMDRILQTCIERLHSLVNVLQVTIPESLSTFTEYFYTQIQQSLCWLSVILLRIQNCCHPLLVGEERAALSKETEKKKQYVYLNEALLELIPHLSVSSRCCLALYQGCKTISRSGVKTIIQTLIDYTPDDGSLDQEKLTLNLNISGLIQGYNDAAVNMLHAFIMTSAMQLSSVFTTTAIEATDEQIALLPPLIEEMHVLFTYWEDINSTVCDVASPLAHEVITPFTVFERNSTVIDEMEMMNYIERSMSSRSRILPLDIRPTMKEVMSFMMKYFLKEVVEEIRASIIFDYQLHNIIMNLGFIRTMISCILPDVPDLKVVFDEVVFSAYERCYGATAIPDFAQKKMIESGIDAFKKAVEH